MGITKSDLYAVKSSLLSPEFFEVDNFNVDLEFLFEFSNSK